MIIHPIMNSNIDNDVLTTKLTSFEKERSENKQRLFYHVVRLGCLLFGLGVLLFPLVYIGYMMNLFNQVGYAVYANISMLCIVNGLVLMSLVPSNDVSLDDIIKNFPVLNISLHILLILSSLIVCILPPYFGFITFILSIFCTVNAMDILPSKFQFQFTYLIPIYLFLWIITIILYSFFMFVVLFSSDNPNNYILSGGDSIANDTNLSYQWIACGLFFSLGLYISTKYWYKKHIYNFSNKCGTTTACYDAFYGWAISFGIGNFFGGIVKLITGYKFIENVAIFTGLVFFIPTITVIIIGREDVFNYMSRRYANDRVRNENDGGFIAALLEITILSIGSTFWVHRDTEDEKNYNYPIDNRRHHWSKGYINNINDFTYSITYTNDNNIDINDLPLPHIGPNISYYTLKKTIPMESKDLTKLGKSRLRCIDWNNFSCELLDGSIRKSGMDLKELFNLSRDLFHGETIDYFITHSWYDSAAEKFIALTNISNKYKKKNGKFPTFWLDKVCINQDDIGDGLRVLPVNIMCCNKMLVLCGETYTDRLWCVWEMVTLFTFLNANDIIYRLEFANVMKGVSNGEEVVLLKLLNFNIENAHCYDPNEEKKLLNVIKAVGFIKFHDKIHEVARLCLEKFL
jgi:hypothetical protein